MYFRKTTLITLCCSLVLVLMLSSCTDRKKAAKDLVSAGIQELEKGNSEAAKKCFEDALAKDPKLPQAWFYLGSTRYNMDKSVYKQALTDLSKAIALDTNYADAYATRGQIKFYLDDKNGACEDFRKAESLGKPNMNDKTRFCP